jgi:serine/threonine protein kinase
MSKRAIEGLTALRTFTGIFGFLPPEIFACQGLIDTSVYPGIKKFTSAVDMWSLEGIVHRYLCGSPTFESPAKLARFIKSESPLLLDHLSRKWTISEEGRSLIAGMLEVQPQQHLSTLWAWGHPWVVSLADDSPRPSQELKHGKSMRHEDSGGMRLNKAL